MAQLTINEIIRLGDISVPLSANYQDKGNLFGERMAITAPASIALVTDALRWQQFSFPSVPATDAIGEIVITSLATGYGVNLTVYVDDPVFGMIILGQYLQQPSDTTYQILATNIANALSSNSYGYVISVIGSVVTVKARPGLGTSINGDNRLICILASGIFDNSFDNTFN
mgnify:CR=1 FL=1|tara:strand:- start:1506 stop:2018 length:513 start_codon:yes stop_codon:yes gene_type:complete